MLKRLSTVCLNQLPQEVAKPSYQRNDISCGIVHLGVGAFHRAHQAAYIEKLLVQHPQWAIVGASLCRPDTKDTLEPQDFLYTLAVRDASGTKCQIIGSIVKVINLFEEQEKLLDLMSSKPVRIISLTITEKGYCHDPASGGLDETHPDIVHDLAHPDAPRTAPGLIVAAIRQRRALGIAPFTVMSCDNLPANGKTARRIIARLAHLFDAELGQYVEKNISFPSTMVDRIVPATSDRDRDEISNIIGCSDAWPIVTEPFSQWVIEDDFPSGRPPFETVGAEMVADVAPFETMKLRLLNGSHSSLAYLGYLAGFKTVSATIGEPVFKKFIADLMTLEIIPTLKMDGVDLFAYRDALLVRFANPALKHATWQIAMDGSQKLPQRLLNTIRDRIAANQPFDRLALGVAAWIFYAAGMDESGAPIDVRDPLAEQFRTIAAAANGKPAVLLDGFLKLKSVFGADLPQNEIFYARVGTILADLFEMGALKTIEKISKG
ncbi:D-mannonate oxidoreductase [hydrothermal vent metagenome]|uniref:D-mannonate oxidoreductase n=1 Tax=hydrothermal vent metagenome TaxID=652676 RepID=A0A3B0TJF7_9ZZZZ